MSFQKRFFSLIVVFQFFSVFTQTKTAEIRTMPIKWKVGTVKNITQIDSVLTYDGDSLLISSRVEDQYVMKVESEADTTYEISFRKFNPELQLDFFSELAEIDQEPGFSDVLSLLKEFITEIQTIEFLFIFDKYTGTAISIKNELEIHEKIERMTTSLLEQMQELIMKLDPEHKEKEILPIIEQIMEEQSTAITETILNTFNYIFQCYSMPYIANGTQKEVMDLEHVDQVTTPGYESNVVV